MTNTQQLKVLVNGSFIGTVSNLQEANVQFHHYVQQVKNWQRQQRWDMVVMNETGARVGGETLYS